MPDPQSIRNFSIIAHIDHGKTTLSDRLLQTTGAVELRDMGEQMLDDMDLERERGITIKARAVTLRYKDYTFNLIDTPGHVDSWYDSYRGVMCLVRIVDGEMRRGQRIKFMSNDRISEITELGVFTPKPVAVDSLGVGEVGFIAGNIKDIQQAKIGDTITGERDSPEALPGF